VSLAGTDGAGHVPLVGRRTFRVFLSAQLLGSASVWMLRTAADWLVLKLTGNPAAVGVRRDLGATHGYAV